MASLSCRGCIYAILLLCTATAIASHAQTLTTLASFNGTDGAHPQSVLVQGPDGNLYGTTYGGGASSDGTVFKITPAGVLTTLHSFCSQTNCPDGEQPYAGLVLSTNGNFYGTTYAGGAHGKGTIFKITPAGVLTTLYNFCSQTNCADGANPYYGSLVQATNGNFYGTTSGGGAGANCTNSAGCGTVFQIAPTGRLKTLYSFCSQTNCTDGAAPYAGMVQVPNNNFFGTTTNGGICMQSGACGTVFQITPTGALTTLYTFCSQTNCADGVVPYGTLVQGSNGNLYGTTFKGGASSHSGTVFEISRTGKLTTLHRFCAKTGCPDGDEPVAGLTLATDGNFYGTTSGGGVNGGNGTIFEVAQTGKLTTLFSFDFSDGNGPDRGLAQATDGTFYGTTYAGGSSQFDGTVYSLSVGLSPFVETLPGSGKVGAAVTILGSNLTGATSVTFHGTEAAFTFVSPTEITTTVPAGATTGTVQVITPSDTLSSSVVFRVQ